MFLISLRFGPVHPASTSNKPFQAQFFPFQGQLQTSDCYPWMAADGNSHTVLPNNAVVDLDTFLDEVTGRYAPVAAADKNPTDDTSVSRLSSDRDTPRRRGDVTPTSWTVTHGAPFPGHSQ
jgi:hypothetical protein